MSIETDLDYTSAQLVGDFLRRYRVSAGHTVLALSKLTGYPEGTLQKWEDAKAIPGRKAVEWMAIVLDIPFDEVEDIKPLCRRKSSFSAAVKAAQRRWEAKHSQASPTPPRIIVKDVATASPQPESSLAASTVEEFTVPQRSFIPKELIEKVFAEVEQYAAAQPLTWEQVLTFCENETISMGRRLQLINVLSTEPTNGKADA